MEFVVSKREFVRGLSRVQSVADRKSAMPILSNVLVVADAGGGLRLNATDLSMAVSCGVNAEVRKGGSVALPAKALFDVVKVLSEGDVTVTVGPNFSARIAGGRRRFDLVGMPGEDFPALPPLGRTELRELPVDLLAELVALTSFSMSADDTRPHLAGALLEAEPEVLRMVTTDGHRLSKAEKRVPQGGRGSLSLLIPAKGIHELKRLLEELRTENKNNANGPGTIELGHSGPNVFVKRDGTLMSIKLVDATFPAYQQVIPTGGDRHAKVSRTGLLDALKAVSLLSSDRTSGVKLQFTGGKVVISSENPDVGAGTDELEAELQGRELTIGFNSKYVIDVLNALSSEDVSLELSGELDPGLLRPVGTDDFVGVVMPMRI